MKTLYSAGLVAVIAVSSLGMASAFAAATRTYQVTGPVLDINAKTITVQKGKEKWEIARDTATEINSDVKVGDAVTIQYFMTATTVEKKGAKPGKK